MSKIMSKADFAGHVKSGVAMGVPAKDTYEQLRKNGYQIEGDPNPPMQSNDPASQSLDRMMAPNPEDGSFLGNMARGANREIVGFGRGVVERIAHPSKVAEDVKNIGSMVGNTVAGIGENLYEKATGNKVPQFKPGGSFGNPEDISYTDGPTKEQQVVGAVGDSIDHALNPHNWKSMVEDHPISTAMVVVPALRAIAKNTGAVEKANVLAKDAKKIMTQAAERTGIIDPRMAAKQAEASVHALEPAIQKGIEKGIKPSVIGKQTIGQVDKYYEEASKAVHTIVQNKSSLQLVDEFGAPTGQLPQSLKQFADAVDQTKKAVYQQYNNLQKEAGLAGAQVSTKSVADDLITAMSDPKFAAIEDQNPAIADYILTRATALEKRGVYNPEQAQVAIQNYNDALSAFYKNPSMDTFQKANVDAFIANKLREGLDTSIVGATGEAYAPLKRQYASLKAIEKDVLNAAMRDARKNPMGLIDFTDIISAGDLVSGMVSGNPALLAKGVAQGWFKRWMKHLNDPNTVIKNMFNKVDTVLRDAGNVGAIDTNVVPPPLPVTQ